jgi:hypothetical protein
LGITGFYFISYSGMETIFILPVLAYLVLSLNKKHISIYKAAFFVMFAFFCRIDSFIITLPLFFYYLVDKGIFKQRQWRTVLVAGLIMGVPVALYLAANYIQFGTLFPISGLAKTVLKINGVHKPTFESFAFYFPYNLFNVSATGLFILVALTANVKQKIYFHLLAVAVLLFYLQTAIRSDWSLWAWYFYPVPAVAFMAAANGRALFTGRNNGFSLYNRFMFTTAALSATVILFLSLVIWIFYTFPIYQTSEMGKGKVDILHIAGLKIKTFEEQHAGVYAMGDRAGIVGYLLKSPLIQMEGLVMDKNYMGRMIKTNNVKDLLAPYNVDYYIASNPTQLNDSTFIVTEPFQSNGFSHRITDTIRWNICDSFTLVSKGVFTGKVNDHYRTIIFKVPSEAIQHVGMK